MLSSFFVLLLRLFVETQFYELWHRPCPALVLDVEPRTLIRCWTFVQGTAGRRLMNLGYGLGPLTGGSRSSSDHSPGSQGSREQGLVPQDLILSCKRGMLYGMPRSFVLT